MLSSNYLRIFTLFFLVVLNTIFHASAQVSTTLYHMYGVPQANQLNPAFQPNCNAFTGFPTLSPLNINVESSSLSYKDVFIYDAGLDAMITFMHENADREAFLHSLKPVNTFNTNITTDLISTGWRKKQFYFTLDITEKIDQNFRFTKDLAEFMIYGNQKMDTAAGFQRFNFSETGLDLNYYRELALGISYNYEDEFQIGARVKVLFGMANLKTRLSDITLKTSEEKWELNSSTILNVAGPFLYIPVDSVGYVLWDSIGVDPSIEDNIKGAIKDNIPTFLGLGNPGFALDFGFNFKPIENLSISASVNDLGFIRWRKDVYNLEQDGKFIWKGIEAELGEEINPGDMLLDSLKNQMNFTSQKEPYSTFLSGKVYLGAAYELNEMIKFGIVNRIRIYNYRYFNQFTVSANVMPIPMFSATLSYSVIGDFYANFGLGLSLRAGPFNLYFITDQAPSGYLWPETINSVNFRLGLNMVFGCRKIPKKMKDLPLID